MDLSYFKILLLFVLYSCKTIDWGNHQNNNHKNLKGDLVGIANKSFFQEKYKWFNQYYFEYNVDKQVIKNLKTNKNNIKIIVFIGTWCDDSQKEIPYFCKVLDAINFDYKKLKIIAVNRWKNANGLQRGWHIKKVPTFIVLRRNKEVGRIVEYPSKNSTLERDLLNIIKNSN